MEDKKISDSNTETVNLIRNSFNDLRKKIDLLITNKNSEINKLEEEVKDLKQKLELSDSRRQNAENMITKIKEEYRAEMQTAYRTGYNEALNNPNPMGGTPLSDSNVKKLVLNNQN